MKKSDLIPYINIAKNILLALLVSHPEITSSPMDIVRGLDYVITWQYY